MDGSLVERLDGLMAGCKVNVNRWLAESMASLRDGCMAG